MGLRLYTPPVESDVQTKPASEKSPAHLRSSIRRNRISRQGGADARSENHRLLLTAAAGRLNARRRAEAERDRQRDRFRDNLPPGLTYEEAQRRLNDFHQHYTAAPGFALEPLDDPEEETRGSATSPRRDPTVTRSPFNRRPSRALYSGPELQYATSSLRSTQDAHLPGGRVSYPIFPGGRTPLVSDRPGHRPHVPEVTFADDISSRPRGADGPAGGLPRPPPPPAVPARPPLNLSRSWSRPETDGLGDRNRSLSPAEGENLWDTLLTTVTPDPQPPSVGSSFASTTATATASAAATQSTAAGSSRTSLTGPDTAEDSTFEPPCDSCYNSDSDRAEEEDDDEAEEDEEDEDLELNEDELAQILPGLRSNRRTYADVVGESRGDSSNFVPPELLSMQRIVRHLARREDIPDEWWAEAGLSRTLSREAGNLN